VPKTGRPRKGAAKDQASEVGGVGAKDTGGGLVPQTETAIKKSHLIQVHL